MRADKGPTATSTKEWQDAVGLCSPSSGTEVVYDSSGVYEEEQSSLSLSHATKKHEYVI